MTIKLEDAEGDWRALYNVVYLNAEEIIEGMRQGKIRMYQKMERLGLPSELYFGDLVMTLKGVRVALTQTVYSGPLQTILCMDDEGERVRVPTNGIVSIHRDGKQIYPPQA